MKQELAPLKEIPFMDSTIETVDYAVYEWLTEKMKLSTTTNKGFKEVQVIWTSAERAFLTKNSQDSRDKQRAINLPIISIERTLIDKDPTKKGTIWGNVPPVDDFKGGSITIARRIKQDKSSNFGSADSKRQMGQLNFPRKNNKVVYETISIPIPVYIEVTYILNIRAQYQQQMNEILQPFMTFNGGINYFIISHDGHKYEAFVQQGFENKSNVNSMGNEERKFESLVTIKVLAHLIGKGPNQEQPKIVIRENAVDVKMSREKIIFGDIPEHTDKQSYVGSFSINGIKKI
jgi:hypothetical protein